jgi:hypothetical protein
MDNILEQAWAIAVNTEEMAKFFKEPLMCEACLGREVVMKVHGWGSQRRLDIRQHERGYPTKTGVSLTPSRFKTLTLNLKELSEALENVNQGKEAKYEIHLGGNFWAYCANPYRCVQIRKRYFHDGQTLNGRPGISLKTQQWEKFLEMIEIMGNRYTSLTEMVPCGMSHENQEKMDDCLECNPKE